MLPMLLDHNLLIEAVIRLLDAKSKHELELGLGK